MQTIRAIIGKGFGDEGKGLATDFFCSKSENALVIKHNGGAQAGHTVETDGKRFVFHQLSAGSFRNADTYWADSYYPDLYKLGEEISEFEKAGGTCPKIYCHPQTNVTIIDDILINMISETLRGEGRHGSCGMGINECDLRTKAGYGVTVNKIILSDVSSIVKEILDIRKEYCIPRLEEIRKEIGGAENEEIAEMIEMLRDRSVIENAAEEMKRNADKYVSIRYDTKFFFSKYDDIIFESGQGLLLDPEISPFSPHVTASRTGLYNPIRILSENGLKLDQAVYVTRSYVTRHGAGPLPYECDKEALGNIEQDMTNEENPWQGSIRYARHGKLSEFLEPVEKDIEENGGKNFSVLLFITHMNETEGFLRFEESDMTPLWLYDEPPFKRLFDGVHNSFSREN